MHHVVQKALTHPVISLGTAVLWGILEFMALQRLRREDRRRTKPARRGRAASPNCGDPCGHGDGCGGLITDSHDSRAL